MRLRFKVFGIVVGGVLLACGFLGTPARADGPVDLTQAVDQVKKSLVFVEYTFRNENGASEGAGQGIIVNKDGVVMASGALIPEALPRDWVKDIKIRQPMKDFTTVDAKILGRTADRLFIFLKVDGPLAGEPLDMSKVGDTKIGQDVFSIGRLSKAGGYEPFVGTSTVRTRIMLTHDLAATASFSLTEVNSPVYDRATGNLIGFTFPSPGENMELSLAGRGTVPVTLRDEDQDSLFVVYDDVKNDLADIPTKAYEPERPWLGVDGLTGLEEDVKTLYSITQPAGITVGSVIPGQSAAEAGLKDKDIVLTIDGKPFSTSAVSDLMLMHFQRAIELHKVGDKVTLGILRDGKAMDIPVTLKAQPKTSSEMAHVFDKKLGIATRDLVFTDTYARKLPQEQKGVMVALVKQGAPASLGGEALRVGDLITKINGDVVVDQKSFADQLTKAEADQDRKEIVFVVIEPNSESAVRRIDLSSGSGDAGTQPASGF